MCLRPDPSCSKSEKVDVLGHLANQTRKTPEKAAFPWKLRK